jgi:hypothetical protein
VVFQVVGAVREELGQTVWSGRWTLYWWKDTFGLFRGFMEFLANRFVSISCTVIVPYVK